MRLYNRRKIIRFLALHVCFFAFAGPLDFFGNSPVTISSFLAVLICAQWACCLSPTPKACTTALGSWQPGRLYSRHAVDLAKGLQKKRGHQPCSPSQSRMNAFLLKLHISWPICVSFEGLWEVIAPHPTAQGQTMVMGRSHS